MLEIKSVKKQFGDKKILKGIDLNVKNGEIMGLLGKNGAGKTTLIKCINHLYQYEGNIYVNGKKYTENPEEYLNNVGILLEPSYYDYMTALENLKAYALLSDIDFKSIEKELYELLEILGLEDALNKKVREFSFGMKQKLGVVMAFMKKPDVLVLDEPSIGVDPKGLDALFGMLKDYAKRDNMAIVFSSNNLKEVQDVSDKIAFLKDGLIINTVTTKNMLDFDNSYTIYVKNPLSESSSAQIKQFKNSKIDGKQIITEDCENMNKILHMLVKEDNPILDIERENRFLKEFYA
jgi:ABC-2 type transport system ATP-binding protein